MKIFTLVLVLILSVSAYSETGPRDLFSESLGRGIKCTPEDPFISPAKLLVITSQGWINGEGSANLTNLPITMDTVDDRGGHSKCNYPISVSTSPSFLISCRSTFSNSELILDFVISVSRDLKSAEVRQYNLIPGREKGEPTGLSLGTEYRWENL